MANEVHHHGKGALLVFGSAAVWSFGGAIARYLSVTDSWVVVFWRSVFATLFLLGFMLWRDGPRDTLASFRKMGLPGLGVALCFATASTSFVVALAHTTVANVLLIQAGVPLIAALMTFLLFGERITGATWAAIVAVIAGVGIMVSGSVGGSMSLLGDGLALVVALGRRSHLPAIRSFCTIYVELIRGVPLISVLFMASFMFPLLMPQGFNIDVLVRVLAGITLFAAAYMAEVIRGGLQAVPKGQIEAAATLGLSYWQTQRKIVLPQALAMVVPGIMNNFISTFKDTSLVTIVSLYELTGAMSLALNSDSDWRPFKIEGYIFIALIYFVFCFSMSRYSLWIEKQVNKSKLR